MKHLLFLVVLFLLSVTFAANNSDSRPGKIGFQLTEVPKSIMPICRFTKWVYTGKTKMENEYGVTAQTVSERSFRQEPF